nr:hypothetical protein [Tanacetum cinerariifolium]
MNCVSQKKDVIQYPCFTKLIVNDLMKKFPSIPLRLEENYHSIKDDIVLVSIYTMRSVNVRGMLILDAFLTEEIRATDDYKEYEMVFVNVVVLMNQPQPVISTYGMHWSGSHKENLEHVDDDDDKEEEKVNEKEGDEMDSLETRTKEMLTPIPITPRSLRINLSSDKNITQEMMDTVSLLTPTTSKDPHSKRRISRKYSHLLGALPEMCKRQGYMIKNMERKCVTTDYFWKTHKKVNQVLHEIVPQLAEKAIDGLIENNLKLSIGETVIVDRDAFRSEVPDLVSQGLNAHAPKIIEEVFKNYFEKYSSSKISYMNDDFHSHGHEDHQECDDHQEYDAPPRGEKTVKRIRRLKVYSLQGEWDAWEEETVIDEDEVIPNDETTELIKEFQNVDKRAPTIFDRAKMEVTLNDMFSNQFKNAEEYAYHLEQETNLWKIR